MEEFIEVGKTGELADGTMKKVLVQEHRILLARVNGQYYAADNTCPHLNGDLSAGRLEGTVVTCPRHSSQFDLRDGKVVRWLKGSGLLSSLGKALKPPLPIKTYPVRLDGDRILVEI